MSWIYLASPYSDPDESVRTRRYLAACRAAARLMLDGHVVFCPVAHSHPIAMAMPSGYSTDHDFWMRQDIPLLIFAAKLVVLTLPGWDRSLGVQREMRIARQWGKPIEFMDEVMS